VATARERFREMDEVQPSAAARTSYNMQAAFPRTTLLGELSFCHH